ncbi:MAG: TIGR00269 family protein [Candidatus Woesearchaeota archaeon]
MKENLSNKKFLILIEKKVRNTIRKYKLFSKKEKIVVAVSGGKDSTTCLYILKQLGFNIEAITIDVSIGKYTKTNLENIKIFCENLNVPLHIYSLKNEFKISLKTIKSILKKQDINYSYCMICGILKRYLLNKYTRELNFDCVVTGHNLDDESQAFIMNVFRNDFKLALRQGPIPGIVDCNKFIKKVKPLFFITEEDIRKYSKIKNFSINYDKCPYSKDSFRNDFKEMLNKFELKYPSIKYNIVHFQQSIKEKIINNKSKSDSTANISLCKLCSEPSSKQICKACSIITKIVK